MVLCEIVMAILHCFLTSLSTKPCINQPKKSIDRSNIIVFIIMNMSQAKPRRGQSPTFSATQCDVIQQNSQIVTFLLHFVMQVAHSYCLPRKHCDKR